MLKVNTDALKRAVENHGSAKTKIAALADSSTTTLDSALSGDPSMNLSSLQKLADFLGLDIEVTYRERTAEVATR